MMNMLKNVAEAFTPVLTESHFTEVSEGGSAREADRRCGAATHHESTAVLCCATADRKAC